MDNDSARQRLLKTSNLETNKNVKGVEIRQDVAKAVKTEIYQGTCSSLFERLRVQKLGI